MKIAEHDLLGPRLLVVRRACRAALGGRRRGVSVLGVRVPSGGWQTCQSILETGDNVRSYGTVTYATVTAKPCSAEAATATRAAFGIPDRLWHTGHAACPGPEHATQSPVG